MQLKEIESLCIRVAESNDEKAFAILFDHFSPGLLAYITTIVQRSSVAEELVADVFINLWKNRATLLTIRSLSYYLYTSGKNLSINYLKSPQSRQHTNLDEIGENTFFSYRTPEADKMEADYLKALIEAVQTLPSQCQLIFRLSKEEQLTHKEIARLLDISTKTVENQITIALKKIVAVLRKEMPELKQANNKTGK